MPRWGYCFFFAILLVCSCVRPTSEELYQSSDKRDAGGAYSFSFDMSDTLSYDVTMYTIMDCSDYRFSKFKGMQIRLEWHSPMDSLIERQVWLDGGNVIERSFYSKRFSLPLAQGVTPYVPGMWTLRVTPPPKAVSHYRMSGLGVRVSQK